MPRKEHYQRHKEIQAEKRFWASQPLAPCCMCAAPCNGSIMRTSHKSTRARDMMAAPEIPAHPSGHGILLCHLCQREAFFRGGFMSMLAREAERLAHEERFARLNPNRRSPAKRFAALANSLRTPA